MALSVWREIVSYHHFERHIVKEQLLAQGAFTVTTTPDQAVARVRQEVTMWAKVIKEADVKPD